MKVSIITATYNSAATISDTLASLKQQSYQDIELIVVDGGSSDDTLSIVKQYGPMVSHVISEPDEGIYDALNKGIQAATGDIVGFLHSDDLLAYSDAIEDIVTCFDQNQSQAIYGDLTYVSRVDTNKVIRHWRSGEYKRDKMKQGWMPPHPTFYMRRDCYKSMGGFDLSYKIAADYDSLLRYLWIGDISISYIPKVLVNMRVGGESNRSLNNIVKKSREDIRAMKNAGISVYAAFFLKNISKLPQFFIKKSSL